MIVHFYEPPPAQKAGGLDFAIQCIRRYLERVGIGVTMNQPAEEFQTDDHSEAVAHFHGLWQPSFSRISSLCRRQRIPYVISPHGMLEPWAWSHKRWKKWPYFFLRERRHLSGAANLLATSDTEAQNLVKFVPQVKCTVLPLGLTAEYGPDYDRARQILGWDPSETVLLFLSRIHPKKGLDLLLRSLLLLGTNLPPSARLVIVGGGDKRYMSSLRGFISRHRRNLPRIDWIGEVWDEKKWSFFQGADLYCLPTYSENFGLTVLESLQVGTRVLTTDQTPWRALREWSAGIVVRPNEQSIAAGLAEYFCLPPQRPDQRLQLARETVERYSWEAIGFRYVHFYRDVIGDARG